MIGGVDYKRNQFNIVTQGSRQPGSAMKPLVYGAFFEQGHNPYESIDASTYREMDGNKPWVVDGQSGSMSVISAIAFSKNTPAIRAMKAVGPQTFVRSYAPIYGIKSKIAAVPSLVLGSVELRPIELATAYSVFQQNGNRVTPYGIKRITDSKGHVLMTSEPRITKGVLSSGAAEDVDRCLREVVTRGSGTIASGVKRARGKTGTTTDNKDAWFVGYTDNYIAFSWVGNEQFDEKSKSWKYRKMADGVMGGLVPIRLWRDVMLRVQDKLGEPAIPRSEFQQASEYNTAPTNIDGENFESNEERIGGQRRGEDDLPDTPSGDTGGGDTPATTPDETPTQTPDASPPTREPDPKPTPDDPVEPVPTLPDDPGGTGEPGTG
jgi:penicillin-binding protein 1A